MMEAITVIARNMCSKLLGKDAINRALAGLAYDLVAVLAVTCNVSSHADNDRCLHESDCHGFGLLDFAAPVLLFLQRIERLEGVFILVVHRRRRMKTCVDRILAMLRK